MKFTAFVLATAAATASAQSTAAPVAFNTVNTAAQFNTGAQFNTAAQFNPFAFQTQGQQFGGVNFAPYQVQQPLQNQVLQQPIQYQVQQPMVQQQIYQVQQPIVQQVDPLAWERDCTWINSVNFRAALSMATCGAQQCSTTAMPNGNGGGSDRKTVLAKADRKNTPDGPEMHVWGSVMNRAGRVCAVAYTGADITQQFPYGRIQSMKRANTANALSLPSRAMPSLVADRHNFIETASASASGMPGRADNGWYGFSHDRFNPGNIDVQFQGATSNYGEACGTTRQDPMCMQKPGGMDFSAGGLPLYDSGKILRGAIGVAGDNDCTSHAIAWKARQQLAMDYTPVNKMRATFNDNAACVAGSGAVSSTPFKETARELCDTFTEEPADFTPLLSTRDPVMYAGWGHTGGNAEDNVFFSNNEARNFPACYDLIRRFPIDNPTK